MMQKKFLMMPTKNLKALLATANDEDKVEIQTLIEKRLLNLYDPNYKYTFKNIWNINNINGLLIRVKLALKKLIKKYTNFNSFINVY